LVDFDEILIYWISLLGYIQGISAMITKSMSIFVTIKSGNGIRQTDILAQLLHHFYFQVR